MSDNAESPSNPRHLQGRGRGAGGNEKCPETAGMWAMGSRKKPLVPQVTDPSNSEHSGDHLPPPSLFFSPSSRSLSFLL